MSVGTTPTNKGLALINKLLAAQTDLKITRVAVGDGTPPSTPEALNALVHEVMEATVEGITAPTGGESVITITVSSVGISTGFFIREIGVFAEDPDEGEILYSYSSFADHPQWIRPEGSAIVNVATYDLITIVDRIANISYSFNPSSFVTRAQLEPLEERIAALEKETHVEVYGVRWPQGSSVSKGERIYNAVGMTAEVGTDAPTVVVNDFDRVYPFAGRRRCNGYRDADRNFIVTAYEGEPGYSINDPAKLVYVETPLFYYFDGIEDGYEIKAVSSHPVPGFLPSPAHLNADGTVRLYSYSAAYLTTMETVGADTLPTSRSGVYSSYNSLNGWATNIAKLGAQYTGMTIAEQYIDTLLAMVEFATKDVQTVMAGATSLPYSDTHVAIVAETAVNRILITKAQAAGYVVGQAISIATTLAGENVAKDRAITAITDKSTEETYLYFDGAAVNIAIGNIVSSRPWVNGATDVVAASSGSPVDNTSGKYPCKYRGRENPWGNAWVNVADLLASREGDTEENYKYYMNYLPDPTKYAAGAITADYVKLNYELPGADGYVKEFGVDERYPWVRMAKTLGASNATYYADYYYFTRGAVGAVLVGGDLGAGRHAGPCFFYCNDAPSLSYWSRRARLS